MSVPWRSIPCTLSQVRLEVVLTAGQSFRWRETDEKVWTSVLQGKIWKLKQDSQRIYYQVFEPESKKKITKLRAKQSQRQSCEVNTRKDTPEEIKEEFTASENDNRDTDSGYAMDQDTTKVNNTDSYEVTLREYFQLDVDLQDLYVQWCEADPCFSKIAKTFTGIRTLRQDPVENLFSFICSSNNNIPRITSMVEKMCAKYGTKLMHIDGLDYYSFPSVSALADPMVEQELRTLGFGYRAKFVNKSAQAIVSNGEEKWLYSLRNETYPEAHKALCKLSGVGSKVADCVCLMSLDKASAIPVDTHVWQITAKFYMPSLTKTKTLTDKLYQQIGDHYRMLFGKYAGWAHSVLFCADLKKFQDLHTTLPDKQKESKKKPSKTNKRTSSTPDAEKTSGKKAKKKSIK